VTGIVHKVREGETVQSIAKKYKTESQKIVNFPFNDFTDLDTFALATGQTLIVPDGCSRRLRLLQFVRLRFPSRRLARPASLAGHRPYYPKPGLVS
jgi:hypothetical protein